MIIATDEALMANDALQRPEKHNYTFETGDKVLLSVCEMNRPYTVNGTAIACERTRLRGNQWKTEWHDGNLELLFDEFSR
ncbi:MAG: hypothetical protein AAB458_03180 [Patescibacteria group bacterium]